MTITQQVRNLLSFSPKARNDDKELYILYLQKSGMELTDKQLAIFRDMPSLETVRRIRQKLQESGEYVAAEPVRKKRHQKSLEMQQNAPTAKPETLERILLKDGTTVSVPSNYKIVEEE